MNPPRLVLAGRLATLLPAALPAAVRAGAPAELPAGARGGFGIVDGLVVAAYAAVVLGIGLYYHRRQTTTAAYFTADRGLGPFAAGISLFATLLSTISYIALPGEYIQHGPVFAVIYIAALPVTYLAAGWLIIPAIMRVRVTSAYELLEARLGRGVRRLGAVIFLLTRLVWMALLLHTMAEVLVKVLGWPPGARLPLAVATGLVTTVYSVAGGLRAVVATDVLQFFVLLLGAVLTLATISTGLGGVAAWWPSGGLAHWAPQPWFSADPQVRITVVGTFVGTVLWWLCTSGSDQLAIQRYLSTRDTADARRAFLLNNLADATVTALLTLVGVALVGFFRLRPAALPADLTLERHGDALFGHYISHHLPAGVAGAVVAGLLAAAMSSLSSGINAVIAVLTTDFPGGRDPGPGAGEAARVRRARRLAAAAGLVTIAASAGMGAVPGNLLEVANKTVNLFVCPMFGLFFLALFVPFATPFGAVLGAALSFAAAVVVGYWEVLTRGPAVSFQWIAPVSLVVSLAAGTGLSLLPTRGRPWPILLAWTAAALAPCAAAVLVLRP